MKTRVLLGVVGLAGAAIAVGQMNASTTNRAKSLDDGLHGEFQPTGGGNPDVLVWEISGTFNASDTLYRAYSVGTTSCNHGDTPLLWSSGTNQHPVIAQSMFRLKDDESGNARFEQIGQGWLKHGFCALDLSDCGPCQGTGCGSLGVNCSDPYTASRNASQGPAGPKYQVNASTGFFPFPMSPAPLPYSGDTARRMKVLKTDVEEASNPGAEYFFEAHYVHPQDNPAATDTSGNNASYRKANLSSTGFFSGYIGNTVREEPGINAWAASDPPSIPNDPTTGVIQRLKKVTGEGLIHLSYRVYDNENGTWDYEYAIENLDVDRSIGSFSVPVPDSVTVTKIGFHDVNYYDGDGNGNVNFSGLDWDGVHAGGAVTWATEDFSSNPNANAIRWGTMYNFRYTANSAPQTVVGTMGMFKPGTPSELTLNVAGPQVVIVGPCDADLDGSGDVGFGDVLAVIGAWGPCAGACPEDLSGNGQVDFADILEIIAVWGPCP